MRGGLPRFRAKRDRLLGADGGLNRSLRWGSAATLRFAKRGETSASVEDGAAERPAVVERRNVALIAEALSKLQRRTGLTKVDVVKRALVIYEFIDAELREGKQIVVRGADGTEQLVKIFC
jgi:hypothetical protein